MNEFLLITGMTLVTFGVRYPILALFGRIPLPETILGALKYVPPAVLISLILPAMLLPDGQTLFISPSNAYLVSGIAAFIIAAWRKNLLWTFVGGMVVFLLWRWGQIGF
jgi:branched-subunit amino acid transport protein